MSDYTNKKCNKYKSCSKINKTKNKKFNRQTGIDDKQINSSIVEDKYYTCNWDDWDDNYFKDCDYADFSYDWNQKYRNECINDAPKLSIIEDEDLCNCNLCYLYIVITKVIPIFIIILLILMIFIYIIFIY
jgi:hypothetical protein